MHLFEHGNLLEILCLNYFYFQLPWLLQSDTCQQSLQGSSLGKGVGEGL